MEPIKRDTHDIYPFISATGRLAGSTKGKTVIVTGGGKGVGKAITRQFALAGANLILITGRDQAALDATAAEVQKEAPDCKIIGVAADVSHDDAPDKVFAAVPAGVIVDVLVNNAGVNSCVMLVADSEPGAWWRDWEVNVKATYLFTRAYLKSLNGDAGVIVNVTTCVADMIVPYMTAYGGSKMAINRFTQMVQAEYGAQGVRCVCVHPGGIESTGIGQAAPEQFKGTLLDTVDLAAGTVLYLSTPEASYLDGRMVLADWNMEKVQKIKDEIVRDDLLVSKINYGSSLKFFEIVGLPEGKRLVN
ncbi:hypothetical protein B0I35DRAFT_465857 [Stachybotrys elegans]|uniref:NAD(P)-binding protein n=1 Tax=Stachybotrys elegans TaxID=80388 RepID=A0A8K0WIF1_9HYPO|nr:hypothetical protein B0I35DRAFT_465857 [Stachybotrys elegans]